MSRAMLLILPNGTKVSNGSASVRDFGIIYVCLQKDTLAKPCVAHTSEVVITLRQKVGILRKKLNQK